MSNTLDVPWMFTGRSLNGNGHFFIKNSCEVERDHPPCRMAEESVDPLVVDYMAIVERLTAVDKETKTAVIASLTAVDKESMVV